MPQLRGFGSLVKGRFTTYIFFYESSCVDTDTDILIFSYEVFLPSNISIYLLGSKSKGMSKSEEFLNYYNEIDAFLKKDGNYVYYESYTQKVNKRSEERRVGKEW